MKIGLSRLGFQNTSLVDFPGWPASVVFTAGCPLACPYCHNSRLISYDHPPEFWETSKILETLALRRNIISHLVITGGEPLVHPGLSDLFDLFADLGLTLKLDTSGILPHRLEKILTHPSLKYVAMDLKVAPDNYSRVGGKNFMDTDILISIRLLRSWANSTSNNYEFRTTMAPGVVTSEDLVAIRDILQPGERWNQNPYRKVEGGQESQKSDGLNDDFRQVPF